MLKNVIAIILITAFSLCAAESDWSNVQALRTGKHVGVIHANMRRTEGEVRSVSASGITIQADREITIPKDQIERVYTVGRTNRLTRTMIGAGIGLAAGLLLNATVGTRFRNEGQDPAAGIIGGGIAVGTGLGAVSGNGQSTVYRR